MTEFTQSPRHQSGVSLIVGLIMLVLMTLMALSAVRLANTNLKIVGNEQFQNEAQAAAAYALDTVANKSTFVKDGAISVTVNVGMANYKVDIPKPSCKRYRTIPKSELVTVSGGIPNVADDDKPCFTGSSSSPLTLAGGTTAVDTAGASLCAGTLWEVQANVTPASAEVNSGVINVTTAGIEARVSTPEAQSNCK